MPEQPAVTLTLTVNIMEQSAVTGQALSSTESLHQLTHLSLRGWPMVDTDLGHLTHLQLVSLDSRICLSLTSGCLMHELILFTNLHSLSVGGGGKWCTEDIDMFEQLVDTAMPFLTQLNY